MKQFRKLMRFLVALIILVPFWIICVPMFYFLDWLTDDVKIAKQISRDHLNWLLWKG